MTDLHHILSRHKLRNVSKRSSQDTAGPKNQAQVSLIPDLFFDEILVKYKLSRTDIMALMALYRSVWCRPNLYRVHGISPIFSLSEMAKSLDITYEKLHESLTNLERWKFLEAIRPGQYFVRRFFTKDNDEAFGQTYDDFEV